MSESILPKKRKSTSLPPETVEYLKAWMMSPQHIAHPYPTEQEKQQIMQDTQIELKQLTNWFVNNRKRFWKPRVEGKLKTVASNTSIPSMEQERPPNRLISEESSSETESDASSVEPTRKRILALSTTIVSPQRPKFRRVSVQLWKDACKAAPSYDHEALPTLEEATQLFGYAE